MAPRVVTRVKGGGAHGGCNKQLENISLRPLAPLLLLLHVAFFSRLLGSASGPK